MHAVAKLCVVEARLFVREPTSIIFGLLFPGLLLLLVGSFIPDIREPIEGTGGLRGVDVYAPVMLVFALTMVGIAGLPSVLTSYRERGVLRRLRTTPAQPSTLLVAQIIVNLFSAVLASAEIEGTLLRVVQEALANVAQHARAGRVGVTLPYHGDEVTLDVRDDGIGFEPAGTTPRPAGSQRLRGRRHARAGPAARRQLRGRNGGGCRHRRIGQGAGRAEDR